MAELTSMQRSRLTTTATLAETLDRFPGAQRALFRKYHIGGCSSCAFEPNETLEQLCARNGNINPGELLAYLEASHQEDEKLLISAPELAAWINAGKSARLVDIRTREEHDAVALPNSTFFTEQLHQEILSRWPRDGLIAFYDHLGKRNLDAAAYFLGHGFTNVRALRGGIDAWSREVDSAVARYKVD